MKKVKRFNELDPLEEENWEEDEKELKRLRKKDDWEKREKEEIRKIIQKKLKDDGY